MSLRLDPTHTVNITPTLNTATPQATREADSVNNPPSQGSANRPGSRVERGGARVAALTNLARPERSASLSKLPVELIRDVGRYLPDAALAALSATNKAKNSQLDRPLRERKRLLDQSKTLTAIPRERRLETLNNILSGTHPRADVLKNLINAYGHIPREHRANAEENIRKKAAELPDNEPAEVLKYFDSHTSSRGVFTLDTDLHFVDRLHDGIAQSQSPNAHQQIAKEFANDANSLILHQDYLSDLIKALADKTNAPEVLAPLAGIIWTLPETEKSAAWDMIFKKTQHPAVLAPLAESIAYLPEAERNAARDAILTKTQDPEVLAELARSIG